MEVQRKLYRSDRNHIVAGVFGGVEEFTGGDATVLRVLFVLFVIFTGFFPGILAYVLAVLIIPRSPGDQRSGHDHGQTVNSQQDITY